MCVRLLISLVAVLLCAGCRENRSEQAVQEILAKRRDREQALSKAQTPASRLEKAKSHIARQEFSSAQRELHAILLEDPEATEAIFLTVQCALGQNNIDEALQAASSLPGEASRQLAELLSASSDRCVQENRLEDARQLLERYLQITGSNRGHRRLAQLLGRMGRRREAAVHLRHLLASGDISDMELAALKSISEPFYETQSDYDVTGDVVTAESLREAQKQRVLGDARRALVIIERLVAAEPNSTSAAAFQGRILAELNEEKAFEKWRKKLPAGIEAEQDYWAAMGTWTLQQNRPREAVRCFVEVVTRDPTDAAAYSSLARALAASGEPDKAAIAQARATLLTESANLIGMYGLGRGTPQQMNRLVEVLEELGRGREADAWRRVARQKFDMHDVETGSHADLPQNDERFITCNIDRNDWPLPEYFQSPVQSIVPEINPSSSPQKISAFELVDVAPATGLNFTYDNGDDKSTPGWILYQMGGGGIGVLDFDLDGWPDSYFAQAGGAPFNSRDSKPGHLFRNLGGKAWRDVSTPASTDDTGYGQGVCVADLNQDGFADLLVANIGVNVLLINNGDGTFRRESLPTAKPEGDWTSSIACGDLSGDGLPEIWEVNYVDDPSALERICTPEEQNCNPSIFRPALDRVWQVNATGEIASWTDGLANEIKASFGFGAIIGNLDEQHGNDVYIANDTEMNYLWTSQPDENIGRYLLSESSLMRGCAVGQLGQRQGSMGIAGGDIDRDGRFDMLVTNYWNQGVDLYLQSQPGFFGNATNKFGLFDVTRPTVGWGTQAVDLDRDGWLDLPILNGHAADLRQIGQPLEMLPMLFAGSSGGFQLVDFPSGESHFWTLKTLGRCLTTLDWNGDGRVDLLANHLDAPANLLENRTPGGNWIRLSLVGVDSERDAVGAVVSVQTKEAIFKRWVTGGNGFMCKNEAVVDVGLGQAMKIEKLEIRWPSGAIDTHIAPTINRRYIATEGDSTLFACLADSVDDDGQKDQAAKE